MECLRAHLRVGLCTEYERTSQIDQDRIPALTGVVESIRVRLCPEPGRSNQSGPDEGLFHPKLTRTEPDSPIVILRDWV